MTGRCGGQFETILSENKTKGGRPNGAWMGAGTALV
jgi:hypothetical protein